MYFKQFYLGCLAHASYLIGSDGEAAVVDPQRDVDQYLTEAGAQGLKIKYIIETHLHADFVSGHRELAEHSQAEIVFGQQAEASFPHLAVKDGDEIRIGNVILHFWETPGHTPESICILVTDTEVSDQPQKVLTGDTLFIGDVGRPDLVGSKNYSSEQMASMLYESLHNKLLRLADNVEIYPAHGAGSLCGRNLSKETSSTIGEQKRFNYALMPMSREAFVQMMTTDLPEAPAYFSRDAEINRTGAPSLGEIQRPLELQPTEVNKLVQQGYLILDIREAAEFSNGHIPGAFHIGLGGSFASWAGILIKMGTPIIIVAEESAQIDEAVMRLARVGIESVKGYLGGGMYAWDKAGFETAIVAQMPVDELKQQIAERADMQLIDVRRPAEYRNGHVTGAINAPLTDLEEILDTLEIQHPAAVICQSGYRSSIAASLLQRHGIKKLYNVVGGTSAWINAGNPVERGLSEPSED